MAAKFCLYNRILLLLLYFYYIPCSSSSPSLLLPYVSLSNSHSSSTSLSPSRLLIPPLLLLHLALYPSFLLWSFSLSPPFTATFLILYLSRSSPLPPLLRLPSPLPLIFPSYPSTLSPPHLPLLPFSPPPLFLLLLRTRTLSVPSRGKLYSAPL